MGRGRGRSEAGAAACAHDGRGGEGDGGRRRQKKWRDTRPKLGPEAAILSRYQKRAHQLLPPPAPPPHLVPHGCVLVPRRALQSPSAVVQHIQRNCQLPPLQVPACEDRAAAQGQDTGLHDRAVNTELNDYEPARIEREEGSVCTTCAAESGNQCLQSPSRWVT